MTPAQEAELNIYCRSCYEWAVVGGGWRCDALADLIFG